jgi:endonuclease/exonuclease/phosphatase (EEP) superfamily protein YafD
MPRLPRVAELCLSVGLAGLALATVATWLARFGWPFELFAHFTPQLAVAAALIALANLIVGRARWTGMAALLLVANALPWWHRVHDEPVAAACGTPDIRLVSANVAYDNRDHDTFLAWLEANPADVVVVQELTPAWAVAMQRMRADYPYRHLLARKDAYGVAVLSRWPLESVATLDLARDGLPSLGFVVRVGMKRIRVLGMHTHWPLTPALQQMRDRSLERAARQVREQALPTVLAGDLNLTPYAPEFGRLLQASGLRDAFATHVWRATWTAGFWPLALPIDHVLVPAGVCVRATRIGPDIGSDHRPVHVTFGWPGG